MATTTSNSSTEIDLTTYEAAPGTLITSLLIQTIIDAINELNQSIGQLQQEPPPQTGKPPVIYNVFSTKSGNQSPNNMTVDVTADNTTILGTDLDSWVVVKLDSFPLSVTQGQPSGPLETLLVTGLPKGGTTGYFATGGGHTPRLGLLTVTTRFGTASRIVILQGEAQE